MNAKYNTKMTQMKDILQDRMFEVEKECLD